MFSYLKHKDNQIYGPAIDIKITFSYFLIGENNTNSI
ncbi:hypothetical protein SAMN05444377_101431 [Flavobacterium fontis]|uniref:Uncharacterized protein n=1 Tax=Flavobacterium fontis TaxID=1124188 RepID=A0A1M4WV67_9FLAO|nr:hypothetical protein SAMN05444377_101431 [Flavobacterium fontis]